MNEKMTVCFTGPRPSNLHGYGENFRPQYNAIVNHVCELVKNLYSEGYRTFISGGAQGFDQLAFWAVDKAKDEGCQIRNVLYLPFEGQERRWATTGLFSQAEYSRMKRQADFIHYTTQGSVVDRYDVVRALYKRNHCMVNDSSFVLAMLTPHNVDYQNSSGGTAECVRYATLHNRQVYAIQYMLFSGDPFAGDFL